MKFYKKCVKYYIQAMENNIYKGKVWKCDMADGKHHLAMLLSFKGITTPMKSLTVGKIQDIYEQNLPDALKRIQVDATNQQSYYVGQNQILEVMQIPKEKQQFSRKIDFPRTTVRKRGINVVSTVQVTTFFQSRTTDEQFIKENQQNVLPTKKNE